MQLTSSNYFSREANELYMSTSQVKAFQKCEAAALAEMRGMFTRPTSTALLVGSYVDAHFEGTLHQFKALRPELFKRDGGLKAEYSQADDIIARLESDELFSLLMSGEKQVIRTGEIAGVPFKIKIDSLLDGETCREIVRRFPQTAPVFGFCDGAIVDLKVMRDMAAVWSDEQRCKLPFAEAWGYDIQGAIYQAVEGHMLPFVLAVGTKESTTDLAALHINDNDLRVKLYEIEDNMARWQAVKQGEVEPERCGRCDYCRMTKKLTNIIDYKEATC